MEATEGLICRLVVVNCVEGVVVLSRLASILRMTAVVIVLNQSWDLRSPILEKFE